jgi:protocatechuate 3,4-dioxygenase beta subunit
MKTVIFDYFSYERRYSTYRRAGFYDTQYSERDHPDCRGRLRSDAQGRYGYRAVVPVAYPIPGDGPVGELLLKLGRHNMRPAHLHLRIDAPGFNQLTTALYPSGDAWITSDAVFGVKRSLVVDLHEVNDAEEAKKRGFKHGKPFKLLTFDLVLARPEESAAAREELARENGAKKSLL